MFYLPFTCPSRACARGPNVVPDQDITFFTIPLPSWLRSRLDNDGALGVDFGTGREVTEPVKSPLHLHPYIYALPCMVMYTLLCMAMRTVLYARLRPYLTRPGPITPGRTVLASKAP